MERAAGNFSRDRDNYSGHSIFRHSKDLANPRQLSLIHRASTSATLGQLTPRTHVVYFLQTPSSRPSNVTALRARQNPASRIFGDSSIPAVAIDPAHQIESATLPVAYTLLLCGHEPGAT